ncbi:hypothetical protein HYT84_04155 [Candidatus Micrarchaeota archaeon]|nr:hypothetical protein [Candidatus Micrarchaeota archaeon]
MTRLSNALRASLLEHKELLESWEKKEPEAANVQRPEERVVSRALEDIQFRGIITRGIGKEFWERIKLSKKDFDRFALIYKMNPSKFRVEVRRRLIPVMKRGYDWESTQSRRLRREYMTKTDHLCELLDQCDINDDFFADGALIEIAGSVDKTSEYLEFCSAAAVVDKKPRKRKEDASGDAVFFQELFQRGKRSAIFGVFDGLAERDGKISDRSASSLAIRLIRDYTEKIRNTQSLEEITDLLVKYANEADATISESTDGMGGTTASVGILMGKRLAYMNIGDSRIYGVSMNGDVKVDKLTVDDGVSGVVERSGSLNIQDFWREASYPYLFLGSFSQKIHGKYGGKRVLHPSFVLKSPNIGIIDVSNYDMLLSVTDGFWRHLPFALKGERITDTSGVKGLTELLSTFSKGSPLAFAESLHDYAKKSMSVSKIKRTRNSIIIPSPGDIGILAMSV